MVHDFDEHPNEKKKKKNHVNALTSTGAHEHGPYIILFLFLFFFFLLGSRSQHLYVITVFCNNINPNHINIIKKNTP